MKLGFIGTGEITKAVVSGIISSNIKFKKIYISKRNSKISNQLQKKNSKIFINSDNKNIIEKFPFSTDANATDVGNLTQARYGLAGQQV